VKKAVIVEKMTSKPKKSPAPKIAVNSKN